MPVNSQPVLAYHGLSWWSPWTPVLLAFLVRSTVLLHSVRHTATFMIRITLLMSPSQHTTLAIRTVAYCGSASSRLTFEASLAVSSAQFLRHIIITFPSRLLIITFC
jgi:hypothetical protein